MTSRLQLLQQIDPYVGTYFSKDWVRRAVLHLDEEEQEKINAEMAVEAEQSAAALATQDQQQQPGAVPGQPTPPAANTQPK